MKDPMKNPKVIYQNYLIEKASKILEEQIQNQEDLCFDPQGRVLVTVVLDTTDVNMLLDKVDEVASDLDASASMVTWLEEEKPRRVTTVSIDLNFSKVNELHTSYLKALMEQISHSKSPDQSAEIILKLNELNNPVLNKEKIVDLYPEFYFYLNQVAQIYQKSFNLDEAKCRHAHQEAMKKMSGLIMDAYINAIAGAILKEKATKPAITSAMFAKLVNESLEQAKKGLILKSHDILEKEMSKVAPKPLKNIASKLLKNIDEAKKSNSDLLLVNSNSQSKGWFALGKNDISKAGLMASLEENIRVAHTQTLNQFFIEAFRSLLEVFYNLLVSVKAIQNTSPGVISDDKNNLAYVTDERPDKEVIKTREVLNEEISLIEKIDVYDDQDKNLAVFDYLPEEAGNELNAGIDGYQVIHDNNLIHDNKPIDTQYYRKQFIAYLAARKENRFKFNGDPEIRKDNPESATISMEQLLGKEGATFYKLALEEEMHSFQFRKAVFKQSATFYPGAKWTERPVLIVSGPSGSGKSFAASAALKKVNEKILSKDESDLSGNWVVAVDGGIIRETSQMRKLAIQYANHKGFTGIKDLHNASKVLGKVKDCIQEAAFKSPKLGVVIPETFSQLMTILTLLNKIGKLVNTKPIFSRIQGKNPSLFQKVVAFMGSRRAWKTDFDKAGDSSSSFNLNKKTSSESKAYGPSGFKFGDIFSRLAQKYFRQRFPQEKCMLIINDLILLKDPTGTQNWVPAEQGDKGVVLVSAAVFNQWKAVQGNKKPLEEYKDLPESKMDPEIIIERESVNPRERIIPEEPVNKSNEIIPEELVDKLHEIILEESVDESHKIIPIEPLSKILDKDTLKEFDDLNNQSIFNNDKKDRKKGDLPSSEISDIYINPN